MEGLLENVLCIQRHISNTFRNGQRLHDVIQRLKNGEVDPMKDDWLVLRISKATWYDRSSGQHVTRYYTYDHRRLYCIWMAGCSKVRARIELNCPAFSELARKAHRLGTRLEPLAFKCWCCVLSVELRRRVWLNRGSATGGLGGELGAARSCGVSKPPAERHRRKPRLWCFFLGKLPWFGGFAIWRR